MSAPEPEAADQKSHAYRCPNCNAEMTFDATAQKLRCDHCGTTTDPPQPGPEGSTRALGWDTPSEAGRSSAGTLLSRDSFGHTGFTGTSIWIEPERELFIILLTNRVHPSRENRRILEVRPAVADMVVRALK